MNEIEQMRKYQHELINYMLCHPKCDWKSILAEIRATDKWIAQQITKNELSWQNL